MKYSMIIFYIIFLFFIIVKSGIVPLAVGLFLQLLVITNPSLAQTENIFDPDTFCKSVAYGTKIKDPNYCNEYIECLYDTWIRHSCEDLYFDRSTGECVDPEKITCLSSQPCHNKHGEFVANPYSCTSYYYCANGMGTLGICSDGMMFNPETKNCVRNLACEITMIPEDYCNIVPEGVFIKMPDSCRDYQQCWRSNIVNGTCPAGMFFNAYRGGCDDPKNVDCEEPKPEVPEYVKCSVSGTFIADGLNCDGYFYCGLETDGEFEMIHGNCPPGRFFDPADDGMCLPRTEVKCSYNRCVTHGHDYLQMVNIDGDGCTGFSICQKGKEIARARCPDGQYFNEWTQFCDDIEINYIACRATTEDIISATPSTRMDLRLRPTIPS